MHWEYFWERQPASVDACKMHARHEVDDYVDSNARKLRRADDTMMA